MLIRLRPPSAGPTLATLPSVGETAKPGPEGMARSGSRKKNMRNSPSATGGIAQTGWVSNPTEIAATPKPAPYRYPSGSITAIIAWPKKWRGLSQSPRLLYRTTSRRSYPNQTHYHSGLFDVLVQDAF